MLCSAPMQSPTDYQFTPFVSQLGVEMVSLDATQSCIKLVLEDRHLNGLGFAHGGLLMTLLDAAMAAAARAKDPDGQGVITIEMKTSFIRPGRGVLYAKGYCDHHSSTMAFCRGEVVDDSGRLLCQAMGTFRRVRPQLSLGRGGAVTSKGTE